MCRLCIAIIRVAAIKKFTDVLTTNASKIPMLILMTDI